MVTEGGLDLKRIIEFLKKSRLTDWEKSELEGEEVWRKDEPFAVLDCREVKLHEIDASEFLSFAKQDLEEDSERGRVNALSNAKRAIECRVDEFLTLSCLKGFSLRHGWKLPYKMQVLQTCGVSAPSILRRLITSKRNLLEHEYMRPKDQQEIQNVVDVAELFLEATHRYVEKGYIASATVALTSWFKPAVLAPTWFGGSIGESGTPKCEYHDGFCYEYKLGFDLEGEKITLSYSREELYRRYDLKTGQVQEKKHVDEEKTSVTMSIRDCEMEDVRELMILLRKEQ